MRTNRRSLEREPAFKGTRKPRIINLQLGVTDHDLEVKVRAAFELARSGGRDLDLTFVSADPGPNDLGMLSVLPHRPEEALNADDFNVAAGSWAGSPPAEEAREANREELVLVVR